VEALSHYNSKTAPVQFGLRSGQKYEPPKEQSFWEKLTSSFRAPKQEDEGIVGQILNQHPSTNGEWLVSVKVLETKTMRDPIDATLIYTVSN
jgi:hypothetical protein